MDPRWITTFGLLLDILGAVVLARGLVISRRQALELGLSRASVGDTEDQRPEDFELPAVVDRLRQSRNAIIGTSLLLAGFGLQLVAAWVPLAVTPLQLPNTNMSASSLWSSSDAAAWLQAIAAVAALIVTSIYVVFTGWYVRLTGRQVKATLLMPMLTEYGSPDTGEAIRRVKAWQQKFGENYHGDAFEKGLAGHAQHDPAEAQEIDKGARRRLSQYFFRIRAVCEQGLVDRKLIARILGPEPIDIYLQIVDPLDQGQRRAFKRPPTKKTREFFTELRKLAPDE